ncbi:hypothetical protein MNV49_003534 [Pseudohyphozyma bogoriensis]|nr:hypothetical protein MNV49_003534 [Pseudohyphozyma bogoriensis]
MTDAIPRTPGSAGSTSSRHLKRLSLGGSAFSSPAFSPSPASAADSPISPSTSRTTPSRTHAPRHLRLSMSGGSMSSPTRGIDSPPASASSSFAERAGIGAQPTLTETHADLLSFIAKKERRCLDLREELKRNEAELTHLKAKWSAIVAKSLTSATPPTTTSLPSPASLPPPMDRSLNLSSQSTTSNTSHTSAQSSLSAGSSSPVLSRSPNTLDLSLLSSTFGADDLPDDIDVEIGESVQAAKAWVGGVFGKVLGAVSGIEEQQRELEKEKEKEKSRERESLGVVREEEEESDKEGANRRDSKVSVTSDGSSVGSLFSGMGMGLGFSGVSSAGRKSTDEPGFPRSSSEWSVSTSADHSAPPLASPPKSLSQSQGPPPTRRPPTANNTPEGHSRRRSTFDLLSSTTTSGWASLGKKWNAVSESETFKGAKRSTLNLVDSFEKTLSDTLGPLDPPPVGADWDGRRDAVGSPEMAAAERVKERYAKGEIPSPFLAAGDPVSAQDGEKTPKPGRPVSTSSSSSAGGKKGGNDNWDWSAFLDGSEPLPPPPAPANGPPQTSPKIGGYRRPSLTPARTSSASTTSTARVPPSPGKDGQEKRLSARRSSGSLKGGKGAEKVKEKVEEKENEVDEWAGFLASQGIPSLYSGWKEKQSPVEWRMNAIWGAAALCSLIGLCLGPDPVAFQIALGGYAIACDIALVTQWVLLNYLKRDSVSRPRRQREMADKAKDVVTAAYQEDKRNIRSFLSLSEPRIELHSIAGDTYVYIQAAFITFVLIVMAVVFYLTSYLPWSKGDDEHLDFTIYEFSNFGAKGWASWMFGWMSVCLNLLARFIGMYRKHQANKALQAGRMTEYDKYPQAASLRSGLILLELDRHDHATNVRHVDHRHDKVHGRVPEDSDTPPERDWGLDDYNPSYTPHSDSTQPLHTKTHPTAFKHTSHSRSRKALNQLSGKPTHRIQALAGDPTEIRREKEVMDQLDRDEMMDYRGIEDSKVREAVWKDCEKWANRYRNSEGYEPSVDQYDHDSPLSHPPIPARPRAGESESQKKARSKSHKLDIEAWNFAKMARAARKGLDEPVDLAHEKELHRRRKRLDQTQTKRRSNAVAKYHQMQQDRRDAQTPALPIYQEYRSRSPDEHQWKLDPNMPVAASSSSGSGSGSSSGEQSDPDASPTVAIELLLLSGLRHRFEFGDETAVSEIKTRVWDEWPADWSDKGEGRPSGVDDLRLLYHGRFLIVNETLRSLGISPTGDAEGGATGAPVPTIIHLNIRPPVDDDLLKPGKKGGGDEHGSEGACCSCVVS